MAQINKPSDYFNTKLHTGTGAEATITGVGFQPDLVWSKSRSNAESNTLIDGVRGAGNALTTDTTSAEATGETQMLKSFNSDGFVVGVNGQWNASSYTYVYWNWLASNTTASNTDGSITSTVSVNTTSGFSIVKFVGTGSVATVGHGLGVAPSFYVVKRIDGGDGGQWNCYHKSLGASQYMLLNSTSASQSSATRWNNTEPTSSVFTVSTSGDVNDPSDNHIAYCFAEKKGFSKFGGYTGNGSTNGTFVYTGFKPAFVMIKCTSSGTTQWRMYDDKRDTYNPVYKELNANTSDAENASTRYHDFVSNGFKMRDTNVNTNGSGSTYIYMAFAENPLVGTNNIPTTAR